MFDLFLILYNHFTVDFFSLEGAFEKNGTDTKKGCVLTVSRKLEKGEERTERSRTKREGKRKGGKRKRRKEVEKGRKERETKKRKGKEGNGS